MLPTQDYQTAARNRPIPAHEKASYKHSDFARDVRGAVRGYWSGVYDGIGFLEAMYSAIQVGLTQAWYEGARECGIAPSELTIEEKHALQFRINEQMNYVGGFAQAIETGNKANKGKLTPLMKRALLWINRYADVKNQAAMMACKNKKLKWVYGDTKHCSDCLRLNGRVYRASIWQKYDIRPQMARLECRGYHCQCRFEPTDQPVTPGRPPEI